MRCDLSMGNTRMKFITGAVLLCLASAAAAQTAPTLVGGGATLPELGYTGSSVSGSTLAKVTPTSGSLFAASGAASSYCAIGSGAGKKVLANNDANFNVSKDCVPPSSSNPSLNGFGGPTTLAQPDFAASDAPMSQTEYNNYITGHPGGSKPVELPAVAGAIGIVYKKSGVTSLNLTEAQICGVFSGQIKTWDDAALAGAFASGTAPTGNITIVYRSDNSGTSFSMLNHLSAVCPLSANVAAGKTAATQFKTLQSFATGAASYTSAYAASSAQPSNKDVVNAVSTGTDGSIAYAEAANSLGVSGVRQAAVKNTNVSGGTFINPLTGFGPTTVPVTLLFDKVIADTPDSNGRPVLNALSTTTQCVAVADPNAYGNPTSGYPIVAVSYLLGNTTGNGSASLTPIRTLLGSPYNTGIRSSVTRIGRANTGYAFVANAALTQSKVDGCVLN
jgi:phosphate transport system substrate-binding protein